MIIKSFFAGFGGQGVLSMGYTLAYAGMLEDKHVTYLPVYGAEVRGGTAHCTVAIGDEEISSPLASEPEYVVVMNLPSMLKFQNQVASGGMFFLNTTLIEDRPIRGDLELVEIPATALAEEIKNPRGANMIMLGAFVKKTELVALDSIHQALERIFAKKKKLIQVNRNALDRGFQLL
ncbi:MAG: 2-oxoacid:ferredoxin oxidoreductase subunit gamma [Deltaproteobacteria bacterium RBG_13_61_14]|nr:MAG: 2-oxoacid:ferredoxin oxidoreductase subunit gamma [Deltaproteobacteria bacterium RBG_13_61_14]